MEINKELHIKATKRNLKILPHQYSSLDSSRVSLVYFCISNLDLMEYDLKEYKSSVIEWIYGLQIHENPSHPSFGGFRPSPVTGVPIPSDPACNSLYDVSHLTMTYTSLITLLILGDDLNRVNKISILNSLKALQQKDGSFCATELSEESDMRFLYCACAIAYILNDWSFIDLDKTKKFIYQSLASDGAFGQRPGQESHGGSTYCAVASLYLMGEINKVLSESERKDLIEWCVFRQQDLGFQGRIGKLSDTCYSFWIGSSLNMLGASDLVDKNRIYDFTKKCESKLGGFSKLPNHHPDALHSYLGMSGLCLLGVSGLRKLVPSLGISDRVLNHLKKIHEIWDNE